MNFLFGSSKPATANANATATAPTAPGTSAAGSLGDMFSGAMSAVTGAVNKTVVANANKAVKAANLATVAAQTAVENSTRAVTAANAATAALQQANASAMNAPKAPLVGGRRRKSQRASRKNRKNSRRNRKNRK